MILLSQRLQVLYCPYRGSSVLEVPLDHHRLKPFGAGTTASKCKAIVNGVPTIAADEVTSRRISHSPLAQLRAKQEDPTWPASA